jgi:ubiquinone/menaquinone biosynthesis C-methylase UbiE
LNLIGVSLDENKAAVNEFVAQKSIFWPEICDGKADAGEVAKLYNAQGTPDLFVIDRAGNIAARVASAKLLDQQLTEVAATDPYPPRTQRDTWQRPVKIMEDLGIRSGGVVADVGAGSGYLTFRLAARVGPKGKVYAEDLDEKVLAQIGGRSKNENLVQIETIRGAEDDPKLPASALDAILVVDAFHEFTRADAMVAGFYRALKPGGRLGVIDHSAPLGQKNAEYMERHHLPQENLIERVARSGLRLISFDADFARPPGEANYYFAVFEKSR